MTKFNLLVFVLINFHCFCCALDTGESVVTSIPPLCLPEQLVCDNGNCYDLGDICNFRDDCGDATDERDCSTDCSFETEGDLCGWSIANDSSIKWSVTGFPAQEPGPAADHDGMKDTHVLSIWNKGPEHFVAASLQSMTFNFVSVRCELTFWYYMASDGDSVTLSFVSEHEGNVVIYPELDITEEWLLARFNIYENLAPGNFTLQIQAIDIGSGIGYIAIDDIKFEHCAPEELCTTNEYPCFTSQKCIPYFLVCDGAFHCSDGSDEMFCESKRNPGDCSFDSPDWLKACDWQEPTNDDIEWILGNNTSVQPERSGDHTFGGEGFYIYVTGSNGTDNIAQVAPLYTYPASSDVCYLRFWYFFGNTTEDVEDYGSLKVFLLDEGGTKELLATVSGEISEEWQEDIQLVSVDKNFTVLFEAHTGDPQTTFIAMDDVSFTRECVTGLPHGNSTCFLDQFVCLDGQCIPESGRCNGTIECWDGSDEMFCPTPPPLCDKTEFNCRNTNTCISAAFICDGYNDCPNNADEEYCPHMTPCKTGSVYCPDSYDRDYNPCIEMKDICYFSRRCYSYDLYPSVCDGCKDHFCMNNSTCSMDLSTTSPECRCKNGLTGTRCQEVFKPPGGLSPAAITGIILGSMALVFLVGVGVYYTVLKKKVRMASQPVRRLSPQGSKQSDNVRMSVSRRQYYYM